MGAIYAVILCDVVASREHSKFRHVRDSSLKRLSSRHLNDGWIRAPYAVTAWDEFQVLLQEVFFLPNVFWSLVKEFYPLRLRVGIGVGDVEIDLGSVTPLNESATGEAFIRARNALDTIKKRKDQKYHPSSQACTGDRMTDLFTNTSLHLLDALTARATSSQWEIILEYEKLGQQDLVAENLGKADSTISRSLKRSYYTQMAEAIDAMTEYLQLRYPAQQGAKMRNCT